MNKEEIKELAHTLVAPLDEEDSHYALIMLTSDIRQSALKAIRAKSEEKKDCLIEMDNVINSIRAKKKKKEKEKLASFCYSLLATLLNEEKPERLRRLCFGYLNRVQRYVYFQ